MIVLLITVIFAPERVVEHVEFLLAGFQYVLLTCFVSARALIYRRDRVLWGASLAASSDLPMFIQQVFSWFALAAGDFSFVRPGCSGIATYSSLFLANLGSMRAFSHEVQTSLLTLLLCPLCTQ